MIISLHCGSDFMTPRSCFVIKTVKKSKFPKFYSLRHITYVK